LDAALRISDNVIFTTVDDGSVLLNTRTNQYFTLNDVGAQLWNLLREGKTFRVAYESLLDEYEVDGIQLELDLLELVNRLLENGLVESVSA
jgi:hypothetical protein